MVRRGKPFLRDCTIRQWNNLRVQSRPDATVDEFCFAFCQQIFREDLILITSSDELIKSAAQTFAFRIYFLFVKIYKITKISFLCSEARIKKNKKHEKFIADAKLKFLMLFRFDSSLRGAQRATARKSQLATQFGGIPWRSIYNSTFCELEFAAGF